MVHWRHISLRCLLPGMILLLHFAVLPAQEIPDEEPRYRIEKYYQAGASIGTGHLFGELYNDINLPVFRRLGGEMYFNYGLTPSLTLGLALVRGSLFGEIRSDSSSQLFTNLNIKTPFTAPQIRLGYNFGGHYRTGIPGTLQPWIYTGVEVLFFRPLADRVDGNGAPYHYWSDGSIRDLPETPENITLAGFMSRNYLYDTDLRSADLDGTGAFPVATLSIPVGAGFDLNISRNMALSLGISYHYTFTDHLDNITQHSGKTDPARAIGNPHNDAFLLVHAGFSFKYLVLDRAEPRSILLLPPPLLPEDFRVFDTNLDGIIQREEVIKAINDLFNGVSPHSSETIELLIDFYNVQNPPDKRIGF
jgi:hypothetical protein